MSVNGKPIVDDHGHVMFHCSGCGDPMTEDDFFTLSLRLPDYRETRDEYCDGELIDSFRHPSCTQVANAS